MKHKSLSTLIFSLVPLAISTQAQALSFSQAYVFGDSLSDPGNIFNVTQALQPFAVPLGLDIPVIPPVPPYNRDGRFADSLVWVDFLAQELKLNLIPATELTPSPITLLPEPGINFNYNGATAVNSVNFAFGGAQTGFFGAGEGGRGIPGILTQTNVFVSDLVQAGLLADPDALYIIWGGANDYQIVPDANPEESVNNIAQTVETLYSVGARNFLVPNLPNLGKTPRALLPSPPIPADVLTERIEQHNQFLDDAIVQLNLLSNIELVSLDTNTLFNSVLANPGDFGFTDLPPDSCLQGDPLTVGIFNLSPCDNPSENVFWDFIHPTTAAHKILGDLALDALESRFTPPSSVPEPTSLFTLGLVAMAWGWNFKRRKIEP